MEEHSLVRLGLEEAEAAREEDDGLVASHSEILHLLPEAVLPLVLDRLFLEVKEVGVDHSAFDEQENDCLGAVHPIPLHPEVFPVSSRHL